MYLAMNRFTVPAENAKAFEALWLGRDSHLKDMEGFVEFHMLRGPENDGNVLYASHTVWASEQAFTAWTKSEAFRAAHRDAGKTTTKLYVGHPNFEGFSSIQHIAARDMVG
ncbi:MAG: antibiotic biosynthesis monooxygenase [Pseudomonadota bacterium]